MSSQRVAENSVESEHENLVLGPNISSEFPTVETSQNSHIEKPRSSLGRSACIVFVVVLCCACLIVGIVLLVTALSRCSSMEPKTSSLKDTTCSHSTEAQRIKLFELFKKVQRKYFELHPNYIGLDQSANLEKIKKTFKAYDFSPSAIKMRTDSSLAFLKELNDLNVDTSMLKPRENKLLSQMKFYLKHSFGQPYDGNYYSGAWMMGPNFFCWQPICILGDYELSGHLPLFAPKTIEDIKRLQALFLSYKRSIYQYKANLRAGVKAGMVRSVQECQAGLDAFKLTYKQIDLKNGSGKYDNTC